MGEKHRSKRTEKQRAEKARRLEARDGPWRGQRQVEQAAVLVANLLARVVGHLGRARGSLRELLRGLRQLSRNEATRRLHSILHVTSVNATPPGRIARITLGRKSHSCVTPICSRTCEVRNTSIPRRPPRALHITSGSQNWLNT